jgi:hypothetical protein
MARNTNLNVAPGGGGGGMPSRGTKVSSSVKVTVKPGAAGLSPKEVARLKAINAPKTDPNKGRAKSAKKAAAKPTTAAKANAITRNGMKMNKRAGKK